MYAYINHSTYVYIHIYVCTCDIVVTPKSNESKVILKKYAFFTGKTERYLFGPFREQGSDDRNQDRF